MPGAIALFVLPAFPAAAQFASNVVLYEPGLGASAAFQNPGSALGEPARFIDDPFGGAVTPFNAPFLGSQLVQVGRGGSLVLELSTPASNDAAHPYGVDLIVFGNAFFLDQDYPNGIASGAIAAEGGDIDVSADGVTWFRVATNAADGLFPTLGYTDLSSAYASSPGALHTDFRQAVDPSFAVTAGMTFAQIAAGYAGSGGGFGVDIASSGLSSARYVRISVAPDAAFVPEIDGIAVVPAPVSVVALAPLLLARRPRRRSAVQ